MKDEAQQNDFKGGWLLDTGPMTAYAWLLAFERGVLEGNDYRFLTPNNIEAFRFLRELSETACAWQAAGVVTIEAFASREALWITACLGDLPAVARAFAAVNSTDKWRVTAFPGAGEDALIVYGSSYVLLRSTEEEQLAAWLFIRWLLDREQDARWVETTHLFPLRESTLELLGDYSETHPQWAQAVDLLPQDPITVTTRIEGSDNVNGLSCEPVQLPGVRSYHPRKHRTAKLLPCEQVLVPETSTDLTVPGVSIHYFDPIAGRYQTLDSGPVRIDVTGDNSMAVRVAKASDPAPAIPAPSKAPAQRLAGVGILQSGISLLAGLLMVTVLIHALRRRKAGVKTHVPLPPPDKPIISNWLAEARGALAAHDTQRFHTSVFRALQQHLGSTYGLSAFGITGEVVNTVLRPIGLQEPILGIYEKLFLICDQARFSPDREWERTMPETYRLLERVMEEK